MLAAQHIYGPHDKKLWSEGALAMGRQLFRTLPEDVHDRQPIHGADGRLSLIADVRLDNRDELLAALGPSPDASRRCDADVLLACLEKWGEGALDRIVGDFAFALWNEQDQTLLLARDFLGQRPLHYHRGKGFFAFASMPKGLHALADVPYAPDEQAMAEFVTLMPQVGPASFFEGIDRVEAGCIVKVSRGGMTRRRYWEPSRPSSPAKSSEDYVAGLRYHLDQATRSRLRGANGAVGTHLSGGWDSAAVAATAARLSAEEGGRVTAFTSAPRADYRGACPADRIGDESHLAGATAAMYPNIDHVLIRSSHRSPLEDLDRYFYWFDRPMLNACNMVWMGAINAAARDRKLTVMLIGQAGNMSISYNGLERLPELLRERRWLTLGREGWALVAKQNLSWRGFLAGTIGPYIPRELWQRLRKLRGGGGFTAVSEYTSIHPALLDKLELERIAGERGLDFTYRPRADSFESRLWVLGRTDWGNPNKGWLAGYGIDQRDPTADRRLIEYCLQVPMAEYLQAGEMRSLGRRALSDRLPPMVLAERRKGYQAADWHEGLTAARTSVREDVDGLARCGPASRVLDIEKMKALVDNWPAGGWDRDSVVSSYRYALLRGVAAGHFLRKASGAN